MSRILLAGFEGDNNSASVLLNKLSYRTNIEKVYLNNDFDKCAYQITTCINRGKYDFIIAFGQKPLIKSIYLEMFGSIGEQKYKTSFYCETLMKLLLDKGYKVKISNNAGNYLCNHVYGVGLKHIEEQKSLCKYIFIHIPVIKNLTNIDALAYCFNEYAELL